jgi:hypothetical protein
MKNSDEGDCETELFEPIGLDGFVKSAWRTDVLYLGRDDPSRYAGLASLEGADRLLRSFALFRDQVVLLRRGQGVRPPVDELGVFVDGSPTLRAMDDGFTIRVLGVDQHWTAVASLCAWLETCLGCRFSANLYMTPPLGEGSVAHADDHDVFVLQIAGRKNWIVWPRSGGQVPLSLRPGDLLYIPAGFQHVATSLEATSVHITVGAGPLLR